MPENSYYVTTPIYYVNDKPHIGHAYTTVLADVLARYHRAKGDDTFFLTGTDEHGQKVQKAAEANNMTPVEQCDSTVVRFQELWKRLQITNDDFIRTTEKRHTDIVRRIMQDLYDRDLIYKAEYAGRYCVPCERFFTDKDLVDGKCPDCGRVTDEIIESNYFFRMSKYQDWLIDYIKTHPDFIQPAFRANETLGFLKKPLEDLCISRPKSRLSWGIELPFDTDYVCYVWFDALINYISAIGYGADEEHFKRYWKSCRHLIGKDILTTHTVYWPTMLKAIGLEMPQSIFAHGWWLTGDRKMSKSLGNVVNPMDMADKYGVDAFRYFLLAKMTLGNDASFTEDAFLAAYNSDLANDLGNMVSRVVKLTLKSFDGVIPKISLDLEDIDRELLTQAYQSIEKMSFAVENMRIDRGIDDVLNVVRAANRYIERTAPWTLAKEGNTERLAQVIYVAADTLRIVSGLLMPLMPEKMTELRRTLGMNEDEVNAIDFKSLADIGSLRFGMKVVDTAGLFPRIVVEKPPCSALAAPKKAKAPAEAKIKVKIPDAPELPEGVITIDMFAKVELRTAKILEAAKMEGADRLLVLKIDAGGEERPLVAGIAEYYKPEELVGRTIVIVANLREARIKGHVSRGMLLAAKADGMLKLVSVDGGDFPSGAKIG